MTYQADFQTEWKDQDTILKDNPDIVIEFRKGLKIIIDAKNRRYKLGKPRPNMHQMRSYMRNLGARYGIFVHSESEDPNLWKEITSEDNDQRIIWTSVTPDAPRISSIQNFEKTIALVNEQL